MMEGDEWAEEDLPAAQELAASVNGAELFLYPGDGHLFADASLPDYDEEAAGLLRQRVLAFLDGVARLAKWKKRALVLEQEALHVQPAAEAGEGAVCADHPVARQDERKRVLPVRRRRPHAPARFLARACAPARRSSPSGRTGSMRARASSRAGTRSHAVRAAGRRSPGRRRSTRRAGAWSRRGPLNGLRAGCCSPPNSTARKATSDATRPSGPIGLSRMAHGTSEGLTRAPARM